MDTIIATPKRELRRRVNDLPRPRRRALRRAIRRGEAVSDPRDAELAADVAASMQGLRRLAEWHRRRWVYAVHAFAILSGIVWLLQGRWLLGALLVGVWPYLLLTSLHLGRLADRAKASEDKNRALAGTSASPGT
jgi:hypothetical protein